MNSTKQSKKVIKSIDSPSLWNCTLSPGWKRDELEILRLAIMKYGLGSWSKIIKSNCLPGKTPSQLNLQTQRILGQQSLGEFMGIHLDPREIWKYNQTKQGPQYVRKNGCLINTGNNQTKEEREKKIKENKKKWGLSQQVIESIVLPQCELTNEETIKKNKKEKLKHLKELLLYMLKRLEKVIINLFNFILLIILFKNNEITETFIFNKINKINGIINLENKKKSIKKNSNNNNIENNNIENNNNNLNNDITNNNYLNNNNITNNNHLNKELNIELRNKHTIDDEENIWKIAYQIQNEYSSDEFEDPIDSNDSDFDINFEKISKKKKKYSKNLSEETNKKRKY